MAEKTRLSLKTFLETFKDPLRDHIVQAFPPVYMPRNRSLYSKELTELKRRPYPAQADAVSALALGLQKEKSVFLVGETGVGKTLMGAATAHLIHAKAVLSCEIVHLRSISDLRKATCRPISRPRWYILNRERAKLSYRWKAAIVRKRLAKDISLLVCPSCFTEVRDHEGIPISLSRLSRRKETCSICRNPLWQADRNGVRRYALSDYIKKRMKRKFDLLILDEAHEFKARDSAQGIASGALKQGCRRALSLTGTLYGGYSTSIFYLLYRLSDRLRKEWEYGEQMRWAAQYGILERITREGSNEKLEDGSMSRRRGTSTRIVERPGVSPAILAHLLPITVFLRLSNLGIALPPFEEKVIACKMDRDQGAAYKKLQKSLSDMLRPQLARGNKSLLGAYLQALLCYPDQPFRPEKIFNSQKDKVLVEGTILPESRTYPKEKELLRIIREELSARRRVLVYVSHTQERDITPRLKRLLDEVGIRSTVLKSHMVKAEDREEWIEKEVKKGLEVLITHPKMVQTGLDLFDFPTLIFFEPENSVYTIRQASRRSWRPGQTEAVRCYYLIYDKTIQEQALTLIAAKVRSALLIEGELVDSGLTSYKDNDFFLRLARTLLGEETIDPDVLTTGIARPSDVETELNRDILPDDLLEGDVDQMTETAIVVEKAPPKETAKASEGNIPAVDQFSGCPEQMALF